MDDKERQSAQANAQKEREKGADLEYDAKGADALTQPTSPADQKNSPQREEKK